MHRNIKILLTSSILLTSGINLFAPIYAIYVKDIGGTIVQAGAFVGLYIILQANQHNNI